MNKKLVSAGFLFFFVIFVVAIGAFYQRYVVEEWGDIFHVPWNVWICWIFWVVLAQFIFFILLAVMLLIAISKMEPEQSPTILKAESKVEAADKEPDEPEEVEEPDENFSPIVMEEPVQEDQQPEEPEESSEAPDIWKEETFE